MKPATLIWLEYIGFRVAIGIVGLVPLTALSGVATATGNTAYYLLWPIRRRAIRHLRFAGLAKTHVEAARIARKTFVNLILTALEILKSEQVLSRSTSTVDFAAPFVELQKIADLDKGFIVVTAHYGNWELASFLHGVNLPRLHCVFRPLDNPYLNRWLSRRREALGQHLVPKRAAARQLLRALRAREGVVILADQHSRRSEGAITTFFGQQARTHTAPAMLKLKTGAPLFVAALKRAGEPFRFEYVFRGPLEIEATGDKVADAQALTQLYTSALEEIVREDPTQWLWMHRRWLGVRSARRPRQGKRQRPVAENLNGA